MEFLPYAITVVISFLVGYLTGKKVQSAKAMTKSEFENIMKKSLGIKSTGGKPTGGKPTGQTKPNSKHNGY